MKKKVRWNLFALLTAMLLSLSLGCVACNKNDPAKSFKEFTVPEDMTVAYGVSVTPTVPLVFDGNGIAAEVFIEVTDSSGGLVQLMSGSFTALDANGYTVRYVAKAVGGYTEEKTQRITVSGSPLSLSAKYDPLATVGESVALNGIGGEGVTLSYAVKFGETDVTVTENAFTPSARGYYDVTVHGVKTLEAGNITGDFTYRVYAQAPSVVGEVEVFGDDWESINQAKGLISRSAWSQTESGVPTSGYGWTVVDGATALNGAKLADPYGYDNTYLQSSVTSGTDADFAVAPRHSVEYYKALANKGYDYVSVWVYIAGTKAHSASFFGDTLNTDIYTVPAGVVQPNTWTELRMPLHDGVNNDGGSRRSFIRAFSFYNGKNTFLHINNRGTEQSESCKVFLSDIRVVSSTKSALIDRTVGDTLDLAALTEIQSDGARFALKENGQAVVEADLSVGKHSIIVEILDKDDTLIDYMPIPVEVVNPAAGTLFQTVSDKFAFATADTNKTEGLSVVAKADMPSDMQTGLPNEENFYKIEIDPAANGKPGLQILSVFGEAGLTKYQNFGKGYELVLRIFAARGADDTVTVACRGDSYAKTIFETAITQNAWQSVRIPLGDYVNAMGESGESYLHIRLGEKALESGAEKAYVYVTPVRMVQREIAYYDDVNLGIIDINDADTYPDGKIDVLQALHVTETGRSWFFDVARRAGNEFVQVATLNNGNALALADYIGSHRVTVRTTIGDEGETTKVATLSFEAVDASASVLWQETSADSAFAFVKDYNDLGKVFSLTANTDGYTFTATDTTYGYCPILYVAPKFTKEALQTYYSNYVLEFDVTIQGAWNNPAGTHVIRLLNNGDSWSNNVTTIDNVALNTKYIARIAMRDIIAQYDSIAAHSASGRRGWLYSNSTMKFSGDNAGVFISPMRIVRHVDKGIVDLKDSAVTTLDFATELGLPAGEYSYKMYNKAGNGLVEDTSFTATSIDPHDWLGYHEVEAYSGTGADKTYLGKLVFEFVDTSVGANVLWQIVNAQADYTFATDNATKSSKLQVTIVGEGDQKQYKITAIDSANYIVGWKVAPMFSKVALKTYYSDYVVEFTYQIKGTVTYTQLKLGWLGYGEAWNNHVHQYDNLAHDQAVHTVRIPMSEMLQATVGGTTYEMYDLIAEHNTRASGGRLFGTTTLNNLNGENGIWFSPIRIVPASATQQ